MSNNTRRLSETEYKNLYKEMLLEFKNYFDKNGDSKTKAIDNYAFWPVIGSKYQQRIGILIIGHSVNGWAHPLKSDEMYVENIDKLRDEVVEMGEKPWDNEWLKAQYQDRDIKERECPYLYYKEAWKYFPRIHQYSALIAKNIFGECDDEPAYLSLSHLAWTNLYKIGSVFNNGKPTRFQCDAQWDVTNNCTQLIEKEISLLKPRAVVVLCGKGRPFDRCKDLIPKDFKIEKRQMDEAYKYIEKIGKTEDTVWVLGRHHPNARAIGTIESKAQEIANAIKSCEKCDFDRFLRLQIEI